MTVYAYILVGNSLLYTSLHSRSSPTRFFHPLIETKKASMSNQIVPAEENFKLQPVVTNSAVEQNENGGTAVASPTAKSRWLTSVKTVKTATRAKKY